jgi:hypothetical protein
MPDLKPILSHTQWSSFKKQHKQDKFSVSGVDLGSALDAYHAAVKVGPKALPANIAAATKLHETLSKYIAKMPKDAKRPHEFDKGVATLRDNVKHNLDTFNAEQHELAQFAQLLQKFHQELLRITTTPTFTTLDEIKKDKLLPPLLEAVRKHDLHHYIADEAHAFQQTRDQINRMAAMKNGPAAMGEIPDLRLHGEKIFRNLQTVITGG